MSEQIGLLEEQMPTKIPKPQRVEVDLDNLPPSKNLRGPDPAPELVESVRRSGVVEPVILVRQEKGIVVLSGTRRIKAAREVGLVKVAANVYEGVGAGWCEVMRVSLNALRHDNPVSDLEALQALLAGGAGMAEISAITGMAPGTVKKRLKLVGLDKRLREALRKGRISVAVAERTATLPVEIQNHLSAHYNASGTLPMSEVRDARKARSEQTALGVFEGLPPVDAVDAWKTSTAETLRRLAESGASVGIEAQTVDAFIGMADHLKPAA
jgi:ParB family chromosome partitioning protein